MVSLKVGLLSHFWALRDDQQSECHVMHIKRKLMNFCVYSSIQIDDASFTFDFIQLLSRYAFFFGHPVYGANLGHLTHFHQRFHPFKIEYFWFQLPDSKKGQ